MSKTTRDVEQFVMRGPERRVRRDPEARRERMKDPEAWGRQRHDRRAPTRSRFADALAEPRTPSDSE